MSLETLEQIFKILFASPFVEDEILFVWHASEPLVLPVSFYERAFELQQRWNRKQVRIANAFQTNAILITQKWCEFFRKHTIHVGVSLDGPQSIHDANRRDRAGKGTYERAMRGVELLRANDIPYTLISVITSASVQQPEQLWRFFAELRPQRLGLNPEEAEGANTSSSLGKNDAVEQYREFFQRLVALNEQSQRPLVIREVENLMKLVDSEGESTPSLHSQTNEPMAIINFDCDGNFSTFSPELFTMASYPEYGNFLFGNVFENALEDIYDNPYFQRAQEHIQQGIKQCKETCPYFTACGGGSPSNKLAENGTFVSTETIACRLKIQVPVDVLFERLERKYYLSPLSHSHADEEREVRVDEGAASL